MTSTSISTGRMRIDFQVREVLEPGSDPADARFVTFGDEVSIERIKDFFEKCGIAADLMFNGLRSAGALHVVGPTPNKILAIKLVREATHCGLKEAKDAVENAINYFGTPVMTFGDFAIATEIANSFCRDGFSVEAKKISPSMVAELSNKKVLAYAP